MAQDTSRNMLQVQVPPAFSAAVKLAADREMTTISEFVRRVLLDRLRSGGIDPVAIQKPPNAGVIENAAA
jgi:hypothetical protein